LHFVCGCGKYGSNGQRTTKEVSMKSVIQEEYAALVHDGEYFEVRGHSLICKGRTYPVAMAQAIGLRPKVVNPKELDAVWRRSA
jgi:hypothetical protein